MEKNVYATLDLTKSLEDFKDNVTKLLEFTNIMFGMDEFLKKEKKKLEMQHLS